MRCGVELVQTSRTHAVVEVASGTVTQSFADLGPTVSIAPDGRRIAYTRGRDGETWVAMLDRDTGDSTWVAPGEHPQRQRAVHSSCARTIVDHAVPPRKRLGQRSPPDRENVATSRVAMLSR